MRYALGSLGLFVACGTSGSPAERLELRLTVTRQGISVIAFGAAMATDCRRHAGTVTFPRAADGTLDLAALTRCARQLKSARPEETQVLLQAERSIEYRELMEVLDAVRTDPTGELFPEVNLGVLPPQDGGVAP